MATDKPCSRNCGRWATKLTDLCKTCGDNKSRWKNETPGARLRYRQRLNLAKNRQEAYAEEFGDPEPEAPELEEPKGKGKGGRRKAEVISLSNHRKTRKKRA